MSEKRNREARDTRGKREVQERNAKHKGGARDTSAKRETQGESARHKRKTQGISAKSEAQGGSARHKGEARRQLHSRLSFRAALPKKWLARLNIDCKQSLIFSVSNSRSINARSIIPLKVQPQ